MAGPSRQRLGELMSGVFKILLGQQDGLPAREVLARLEKEVPPTPFEDAVYPKNPTVRRWNKVVRFASIPFVKAGWLRKDKGTWWVTSDGAAAYATFSDPGEFIVEAVRLYDIWKQAQPSAVAELDEAQVNDSPDSTSILEEAEESAWSEVSQYVSTMNPLEFQDLVAALLKAMRYHVAYISPPGPDRGVDILAYTDPLGAEGPRIKVQVKRRTEKADVDAIRAFMALLGPNDVGIFVCSGGFTSHAAQEARSQESRRLTLIDLDRLFALWVEHYDKVAEPDRQLLPLRPIYFLDRRN